MVGIRGKQCDKGGCGMCRVASRDVKFVCSDHTKIWIAKLPPELMTDGNDFDGLWRLFGLLDAMDYTSSGQKKYEHDKHRNHRPGKLYLVAAVNRSGFEAVIIGALAEFNNGICEERKHHYKNHGADGQYEERKMKNRMSRCRLRFEYIWRLRRILEIAKNRLRNEQITNHDDKRP